MKRARVVQTLLVLVGWTLLARPVVAHAGALSGALKPVPVPSWLVVMTGGGAVGASFLLTSLVTDHAFIRELNDWHLSISIGKAVRTVGVRVVRGASVATLGMIVAIGLVGPQVPVANLAVLVVWAGWWAGYTMTTYLVGNTWPKLNPWRALVTIVPHVEWSYPDQLGAWPSVFGLLLLVWLEVVSPVAQNPRLLAVVILVYSTVTVAGVALYGSDVWFETVDPIARVFRSYGRIAPLQRTNTGIECKLPGATLAEVTTDTDDATFIVALLWVTTYDGLVSTPTWNATTRAVVDAGIPPLVVYLVTIVAGFGMFFAIYRLASRWSRRTANSYVTAKFIREWFAPALVPIAASYHLAHFSGYFLSLSPAFAAVALAPLSPPVTIQTLVLPGWFGSLQLVFVLLGHLLAVWVAHARAFEVFPGRLQPIRSQYPFILVMVFYTVTSMWIIAQPFTPPPFV